MAQKCPESVYDMLIRILPFLYLLTLGLGPEIQGETLANPGQFSWLNNQGGLTHP